MSEEPTNPEPARDLAGGPSAPFPEAAVPEPRKPRRLLVKSLIGLYAVSLAAAGVLLVRPAKKDEAATGQAKRLVGLPKGLLSSAKKEYVGVVEIKGVISDAGGGPWGQKGADAWARRLERLAKKDEVKAIVLSIDSPGGSVGSVQELHSLLLRLRKDSKKPIVAQLGDVAASGGYYLAVACDKIVAHPGTLVGSIGVIFNTMNIEGLQQKLGIRSSPIKSGKMKDIGSMSRPMTEDERKLLQALIDNAYGQFVEAVSAGRRIAPELVKPNADGRIFTGEQAKELGLVDELGDSFAAVQLAGRLGGISGKPEIFRETETLSGILDMLESRLAFARGPELPLLRELGALTSSGIEYRWRP